MPNANPKSILKLRDTYLILTLIPTHGKPHTPAPASPPRGGPSCLIWAATCCMVGEELGSVEEAFLRGRSSCHSRRGGRNCLVVSTHLRATRENLVGEGREGNGKGGKGRPTRACRIGGKSSLSCRSRGWRGARRLGSSSRLRPLRLWRLR